jgi:hypothetical protein
MADGWMNAWMQMDECLIITSLFCVWEEKSGDGLDSIAMRRLIDDEITVPDNQKKKK